MLDKGDISGILIKNNKKMQPFIKHALLVGTTQLPTNQPLNIVLDDEKLKGKKIKGEWGITLIVATDTKQDFSQTFEKIVKFIKNLEIYYSIDNRVLPYVNLFNTIIFDKSGVSYPISSRETVVPINQEINKPVKFSVAVSQKNGKVELPAHSVCLLYMVLRANVLSGGW